MVAYAGRAIFKRNTDAKLTGVRIEIDDLILEGTKDDKAPSSGKSSEANVIPIRAGVKSN